MQTLILKPGGVLLVTGALASMGALAFSRPAKDRLRDAPLQTAPISLFTSAKAKSGAPAKGPFDSKEAMVPIDLTGVGKKDWVCWGVSGTGQTVHKADRSATRIGDFSLFLPKEGLQQEGGKKGPSRGLWWSDGSAPLSKTSVTYSGVHVGAKNGFRFKAPADNKTSRTLHVYVGGWKAGGDFSAFVSDGTVPKIEKEDIALGNGYYSRAYTVTYTAAAPGQDLTVVWKMHDGGGNISLQGAALE